MTTNYLKSLARRRQKENPTEILWEVAESFDEADPKSSARTLPKARKLHDLVRFVKFDGIAPWLRDERAVVKRVLAFARKIKDEELSNILASALDGITQGPATMTIALPGQAVQTLDVGQMTKSWGIDLDGAFDGQDWGGTDVALSFAMDNYEAALLDELIQAADDFDLQPPLRLQKKAKAKRQRAKATKKYSATDLFVQLVATEKPRMEVGSWEDAQSRAYGSGMPINIKHVMNPLATSKELAKAHKTFGPAAKDLLEIYALHNGGELFQYKRKCGFVFAPMERWPELLAHVLEWAEIGCSEEDIPSYLHTAIAFGKIPGDSDSWLLITEGKFAGTVMYSNPDSLEEPCFKNIHGFLSTLLHDTGDILNTGAYVQYNVKGEWLHPMRTLPHNTRSS